VSFKYVRNTCFLINAIKKVCEKHMLLKQHVILTCQWTHVHLICKLYEIFYKPICRKFMFPVKMDKGDVVASSNLPCDMYQNDTMYPVLLVYIRSDLSKKKKKIKRRQPKKIQKTLQVIETSEIRWKALCMVLSRLIGILRWIDIK
jgi:hypothetical protein